MRHFPDNISVKVYPFSLRTGGAADVPLPAVDSPSTLVLLFADRALEEDEGLWESIRSTYREAVILGCSTAGNIRNEEIVDGSLEGVAVRFERTTLQFASVPIATRADSFAAGCELGRALPQPDLRAVFLLSDGLAVNGSELVRGIRRELPSHVSMSGGLAGDGTRFGRTWLATRDFVASNRIALVGFYGDHIQARYGCEGGWDQFGIGRQVTRSEGSVLYELDRKPALALYKQYLGEQSLDLPASGLLFPLSIRSHSDNEQFLVRTILAVDEAEQSLTFAGDVPLHSFAQLMKANSERLIEGAASAAQQAAADTSADLECLALVVSCIGRRLVLKQRAEEELEAVRAELPARTQQLGFYSYGEVAPLKSDEGSSLHNQTMTLTLLYEV